ncbi:hypothetical protein B0H13DRAFT_1867985 [Mycena leptocephala]|nr:hypothetical protein B0H13DRAFT_1867985 [Mycena leptocephala]
MKNVLASSAVYGCVRHGYGMSCTALAMLLKRSLDLAHEVADIWIAHNDPRPSSLPNREVKAVLVTDAGLSVIVISIPVEQNCGIGSLMKIRIEMHPRDFVLHSTRALTMDSTPVKCEDAQVLLLAQRRLVQAEDEKRFLRRRMRALEKELAAGKRRSGFAQGETGERYISRETNVHEPLFWWLDLDTHFTRITQVLSSERAILGELQDQCKQDRGALEELGLQVGKLHQTVNGLNGALGLLRCAVEEAFGREPSIGAEEDSGVRSENRREDTPEEWLQSVGSKEDLKRVG